MSSAATVRLTKQRRDEIDEEIEALNKVIDKIAGSKKSYLQAKVCNLKLKQQKLHALSDCHHLSESSKQCVMTEFDLLIAENEIKVEIESIRSSKKFKRMEQQCRVPIKTKHHNETSTPKTTKTENIQDNNLPICRGSKMRPAMYHKSTNTVPVCVIEIPQSQTMLPLDRNTSTLESVVGGLYVLG